MPVTVLPTANDTKTSRGLAAKLIYAALSAIKDAGGQLSRKEVFAKVESAVPLDSWALTVYEKTGYVRWESLLSFFSIDCVKAGFIRKQKGLWILTPEGDEALALGSDKLLKVAGEKYRTWKNFENLEKGEEPSIGENSKIETISESTDASGKSYQVKLEEAESIADESLREYLQRKNPYEFQDMVAALLRGMGYYVPADFVAPKGKDGGIDIVAYKDPLGTVTPRIKVQVKRREQPASVDEIRQLMGLIQRDSEIGIFVSTGGFTNDSKHTTRNSQVHIELIDLNRFLNLWREFYHKMSDEDKLLLPLRVVHFLSPEE